MPTPPHGSGAAAGARRLRVGSRFAESASGGFGPRFRGGDERRRGGDGGVGPALRVRSIARGERRTLTHPARGEDIHASSVGLRLGSRLLSVEKTAKPAAIRWATSAACGPLLTPEDDASPMRQGDRRRICNSRPAVPPTFNHNLRRLPTK
jgi:hypothetical protein